MVECSPSLQRYILIVGISDVDHVAMVVGGLCCSLLAAMPAGGGGPDQDHDLP
jgi:hypothetical protein